MSSKKVENSEKIKKENNDDRLYQYDLLCGEAVKAGIYAATRTIPRIEVSR